MHCCLYFTLITLIVQEMSMINKHDRDFIHLEAQIIKQQFIP